MRKINKIIVHHSASNGKTTTPEDIKKWHLARGMKDIGYHYIIDYSGFIHVGRDYQKVGAHCKGKNLNSIGICVTGNFEKEFPSLEQSDSLRALCVSLKILFPKTTIEGHLENANTLCPGKNLMPYIKDLRSTL